jgi:hypothetical protein
METNALQVQAKAITHLLESLFLFINKKYLNLNQWNPPILLGVWGSEVQILSSRPIFQTQNRSAAAAEARRATWCLIY